MRMEPLSASQSKALRESARGYGRQAYALITISLCHAVRVSELCDLRVSDFDLIENTVRIRRLKNSNSTTEKLAPAELEIVRELIAGMAPGARLFPFSRYAAYRLYRKCAEAAGLPKSMRGPHASKHTVLQTACDAGASLPMLLKIGGHKDPKSALHYFETRQTQADEFRLRVLEASNAA